MDASFCTLIIDAHEGSYIANFDVPGASMHSEIPKDKRLIMNLIFCFDIMCQVNPEHKQHVRYENGKKVLYLLVIREVYGCI